jgi:hypothetical protein
MAVFCLLPAHPFCSILYSNVIALYSDACSQHIVNKLLYDAANEALVNVYRSANRIKVCRRCSHLQLMVTPNASDSTGDIVRPDAHRVTASAWLLGPPAALAGQRSVIDAA